MMFKRVALAASVASAAICASYYQRRLKVKPDVIICGAGTGGCFTAYFTAKWMEENNIPGNVLLLDCGNDLFSENGPDPRMSQWYENWGKFSKLHDTKAQNNEYYPSPGSSHLGVGGCGAHDTRISFLPRKEQRERYNKMMNWDKNQLEMYLQTVLNTIPLQSANQNEVFYNAVIRNAPLMRLPDNEFKANVVPNSIAYVSLAMFPDELRWTSAYLLHDSVRPKNLHVLSGITVDRVRLEKHSDGKIIATSVEIIHNNNRERETLVISNVGEIVLTAGALGTPAILQRSGIGPRNHLQTLGIPVVIANDEVGHGVDHMEIPVTYEWIRGDKFLEPDGGPPRGGPMGWPIALFGSEEGESIFMAHFGISPPPYGGGDVTATPNCVSPNNVNGFKVFIKSKDAYDPASLIHSPCTDDFDALYSGLRKTIRFFDELKIREVVGERVEPSPGLDLDNREAVKEWMSTHVATVYHWMSTAKAGTQQSTQRVINERFVVVDQNGNEVRNLRIGSGAALPEITEANPHVTISAFSVALAHCLYNEQLKRRNQSSNLPSDLKEASKTEMLSIRRFNEVKPDLWPIAKELRNLHERHIKTHD